MTTVILFDIDGTLVLTGGAGVRAMTCAFNDLFSVPNAFATIPMPGRTDASIFADAAAAHGIPPTDLPRFRDAYLGHLVVELQKPGPRKGIPSGVRELLDVLAPRGDVYLALLSGNFETAARAKLEYFDLWRYFKCGAFGDAAPDRASLLPKALVEVHALGGPAATPSETVVIGDTPLDVACAVGGGARSLAVATGGYDVETLRAAGADMVFEDLSNTAAVMRALALAV